MAPIPTPDIRVIDYADVLRFKQTFLSRNPCPTFTPQEMTLRENRFTKTAAGRCVIARLRRYEDAVLRQFFGEPLPKPEW